MQKSVVSIVLQLNLAEPTQKVVGLNHQKCLLIFNSYPSRKTLHCVDTQIILCINYNDHCSLSRGDSTTLPKKGIQVHIQTNPTTFSYTFKSIRVAYRIKSLSYFGGLYVFFFVGTYVFPLFYFLKSTV